MIRKSIIRWGLMLPLILGWAATNISAQDGQFSADVSMSIQGQAMNGKIFVGPSYYRMDVEQAGEKLSVIVDRKAGRTRVLVHGMKQYLEMKSDDPMSLMNDPFQSIIYTESFAGKKNLGTEKIGAYTCDKYVLTYGDQDLMTYWVSQQLGFPIKIVNNSSEGTFLDLTNITAGPVDESRFEVPAGYTEMVPPGEEPIEVPDWAEDIPSAPVVTPPFEQHVAAGDMFRIPVVAGKSIWVKAANRSGADVLARAIPFKDGLPLKDVTRYNNFAMEGTVCERRHETEVEADEIIIRIFKGTMTVLGKYSPMTEGQASAGHEFKYDVVSDEYAETRMVNLAEGESQVLVSYFKDGQELSKDEIGPEKFRTVTLEPGETDRRTLNPAGDQMVFRVIKGDVLFKLGQYDSFEW